jgi:hypothetical protein
MKKICSWASCSQQAFFRHHNPHLNTENMCQFFIFGYDRDNENPNGCGCAPDIYQEPCSAFVAAYRASGWQPRATPPIGEFSINPHCVDLTVTTTSPNPILTRYLRICNSNNDLQRTCDIRNRRVFAQAVYVFSVDFCPQCARQRGTVSTVMSRVMDFNNPEMSYDAYEEVMEELRTGGYIRGN